MPTSRQYTLQESGRHVGADARFSHRLRQLLTTSMQTRRSDKFCKQANGSALLNPPCKIMKNPVLVDAPEYTYVPWLRLEKMQSTCLWGAGTQTVQCQTDLGAQSSPGCETADATVPYQPWLRTCFLD